MQLARPCPPHVVYADAIIAFHYGSLPLWWQGSTMLVDSSMLLATDHLFNIQQTTYQLMIKNINIDD